MRLSSTFNQAYKVKLSGAYVYAYSKVHPEKDTYRVCLNSSTYLVTKPHILQGNYKGNLLFIKKQKRI